jgi:hypothetical protein
MKVEQQPAIAVMEKKMTVLFRHNRNFCLLPLAPSLGISLATIFQPAEKNKNWGGKWCSGVGWGGVG